LTSRFSHEWTQKQELVLSRSVCGRDRYAVEVGSTAKGRR
jgi:hypothetical protein